MIERSIVTFFMILFLLPIFHTVVQNDSKDNIPMVVSGVQHEETKTVMAVNASHLKCLATGIYYEAGGEILLGQIAVARVIMNRVLHGFGSNPCKVVYQHTFKTDEDGDKIKLCQFSWACGSMPPPNENSPRYRRAVDIAQQVLAEDKWNDVIPNNTLFFHNLTAAPGWVYKKVMTIGNHIFYSKGPEKKTSSTTSNDK
jgi:spore germination cell wall hydrolase CwlJ-like protein